MFQSSNPDKSSNQSPSKVNNLPKDFMDLCIPVDPGFELAHSIPDAPNFLIESAPEPEEKGQYNTSENDVCFVGLDGTLYVTPKLAGQSEVQRVVKLLQDQGYQYSRHVYRPFAQTAPANEQDDNQYSFDGPSLLEALPKGY